MAEDSFVNGFMVGQDSGGNRGSFFGGDGFWYIIIFALLFGWGGRGGIGGFGGGDGGNGGFDSRYVISSELSTNNIESGITSGFAGVNSALCSGFSGVNSNIANLGYQMSQCCCDTREAIKDCCCETREAISGVKYDLAMQHNDLLHNMDTNTRAIIESNNAGIRSIIDKMCQDKIDSLNLEVSSLRTQLSQTAQNALLTNAMSQQTATLLQQLNPVPIPAYVVANPNCCGTVSYNTGCGCNSGCGI